MISVIIPYNKDRGHLSRCLESVRLQTYKDFEIIESFSKRGVSYNFNRGLERAKGEFIKLLCDDDWLPTTSLADLREGIGDAKWCHGNVWQMTTTPYIFKPPYLDFKSHLEKYDMHGGGTLYRRDILNEIGGMDETLETGEEYDMHLKLLSLKHVPSYVDKEVYNYRIWGGSKSIIYRKTRKKWRAAQLTKIKRRYDMSYDYPNMISVIVPYKEERKFLKRCIDSIKAQTYTNFELIEAHGPGTLPENFNNGLRKARGEFIKMVQDDDWIPPDALQHLADGIGDEAWVVGNVQQVCPNSYIYIPPYLDLKRNLQKYALHMGSTMYRKRVLIDIEGMDETLTTGEEYDMHLKLLSLGHEPVYIDKLVYNYNMWSESKSRVYRRERPEWRANELAKIKEKYTL